MTPKPTGPSNPQTQSLIQLLDRGDQAKIWRSLAKDIASSTRLKSPVNLDQLDKIVADNDIIVIPAKVLATGVLTKKNVTIGALHFSEEAERKIKAAGGKSLSIHQLWTKYKKGTNVRIIK